ncbi:MAG: GAF domain-containing protein, partial [Anaerolineae bacterium]|nr:GAF domain-containing protein [Anaerolineae bacterium]
MKDKEKRKEELAQVLPPVDESVESEHDSRQHPSDSLEQRYEQAQRHAEQLETLSVVESALFETTSEAEMLDVFILAVRDPAHLTAWLLYAHVDAEDTTPDDASATRAPTTQVVASWYDGGIQVDDPALNKPLPPDHLPLTHLWAEDPGRIFYAVDVQQAPKVDTDLREWAAANGIQTLMVLPMLSGGHLQGVIVLQWAKPYPLSASEQFVLRRLLRPTVALLARRRAYLSEESARAENAQRAAQFQTAAEVARAASSIIDLNELLPRAVELVRERFALYYIGIFLVDETRRWVALRAGSGEAGRVMLENKHGFPVGSDSMIGRCVSEARPQLPERVETAVRYVNPLLPDTTAEIALPLISRNQMIGAISIQSSKIRIFSEADVIILQTVADQLANAIQNARLFEQLNTSLTESEMQTEVSVAINEAQSVEAITRAAAQVGEFIGMEGVSLRYFTHWDVDGTPLIQDIYGVIGHNGGSEFRQQKNVGVNHELLTRFFGDTQQTRRAQTSGAISVFNDLSTETSIPEELHQYLLQQGYRSMIMAPLSARNRLLGFLTFYSENPVENLPTRYVQVFVRTLIDEVATGLDRYILLRERERRAEHMETALEVSRYAASMLDEEALLAEVAELILERFNYYYVSTYMVDDSGRWAVLYAGTGEAGRTMMAQGHRLQVGGDSMIGQCVSAAAPRIAMDVGKEMYRFDNPLLPDTHSELALPLISRNVVIGAVSIQSTEVAAYSREDVTILQTMADQLATAVGNARLFAESQASLEELQRLQQRYALDMWEGYVAKQDVFGFTYDLNEVSPVSGDQFTAPDEYWGGQLITRSGGDGGDGALLVAPFDVRSEPVGFLSFEEPHSAREWTDDNVAVIEAVREQLSLALENRLLIDQSQNALREARAREREVRFLQEVAAFLNATDNVVAVQAELRDRLQAFIPVDSMSIVGYDVNRALHFLGDPAGDAVDVEEWSAIDLREETGYALVVEQGNPFIQEDIRINPRFWEDGRLVSAGMLSRAILPLQLGTRILGTLNLESSQISAFSRPELMPVLGQVAAQVASAIERANLLQRAQESAGESRTLYEATSALAEATSYETVLRAIVGHTIVSEFAWAEIAMFTPDPETGEENSLLEIVSSWSSSPAVKMMEVGQRIPVNEFPALQLLPPGEQLFICEDMTATTDIDPDIQALYLRQGVRAIVIARLSTVGVGTGGEIGLLRIRFSEPYHPSEQDIRLYNSIADQAAVVLSNQKLLQLSEARTEQLTAAVDFANLATGLAEREDLLRQSVDFFKKRFGFYYVSLFMLDEDGEWAVLQSGTGDMGEKLLRMGQRVRVDDTSMIGWSILNDRPRIAQDVTRDPLYFDNPLLPDVRSAIALPLKSRGQINGALSIESSQRFVFTTELVSTLELMATQLANMLESADLYDRSQSSLAETRMLYRIAQQITDAATVEDVF